MNAFIPISPWQNGLLSQHTRAQRDFPTLAQRVKTVQEQLDWLALKQSDQPDLSQPMVMTFSWKTIHKNAKATHVELSETSEFIDDKVLHFPAAPDDTAQVHSLKVETQYFWRIVGLEADGQPAYSPVVSFWTTVQLPRWIRIDGVSNVRDIGGWKTKDGRRIRQGLLYRGGEMNGHTTATTEGLNFAEFELRLRTDLDLRGPAELEQIPYGPEALSPLVQWVNVSLAAYRDIATQEQKLAYAKALRVCLAPENFPIYTHCWGGADRTGTLIFLLCATLGLPEETLLLDYELTSLSFWGARSRNSDLFQGFLRMLEELAPGQDYQAKANAYWKSCGITTQEIDRLQELFLE